MVKIENTFMGEFAELFGLGKLKKCNPQSTRVQKKGNSKS
jgi:hypothetical protein